MPTYDYKCASCHHTLEAFQKISEEPLRDCPACKKPALQRGFGGGQATFQFKGTGFYSTDSKQSASSGACCPCGKNKGTCTKN